MAGHDRHHFIVHEGMSRIMVDLLGQHRTDNANIICHLAVQGRKSLIS